MCLHIPELERLTRHTARQRHGQRPARLGNGRPLIPPGRAGYASLRACPYGNGGNAVPTRRQGRKQAALMCNICKK